MKTLEIRHVLPAIAAAWALSLAAVPAMAQSNMVPTPTTTVKSTAPETKTHLPTFSTVSAAKASCPSDTVVWSTLSKSKAFHRAGSRYYGKTKHGAYLCEKVAIAAGYHPSKS